MKVKFLIFTFLDKNMCRNIWTLLRFAKHSSNSPFFLGWNHATESWQTFSGGVTPGPGNWCIFCSQIGLFIIPSPGIKALLGQRQLLPSVAITSYYYCSIQFSKDLLGFWKIWNKSILGWDPAQKFKVGAPPLNQRKLILWLIALNLLW